MNGNMPPFSPYEIMACFHVLRHTFLDLEQSGVVSITEGLDGRKIEVLFPAGLTGFLLLRNVHRNFEVFAVSCSKETVDLYAGITRPGT
jgi:hypothetical protein